MLRNRSKIPQKNRRNVRKRNQRDADQSDESSWSSIDSESSQQDFSSDELFLEESSDSSFEDESVSPVIGRNLKTRRKRLNSKSKRSNKVINNRNRNSRSKKKSHRTSDSHTAGPSRINTNSRRSRSANSNTRTAKRKYKDRSDESETFSEICNTSSEEIDVPLFRTKRKRLRQAILNTSESDDSVIQTTVSRRRNNLLDSESSTSASDEIRTTGRARHNSMALPAWTDTSSESIELNSQEMSASESSGSSSIRHNRRFRLGYLQSSDSGSNSSPLSNSLFSVDSEVANITSILDSEASSSYNTAQSTSSNNFDNKEQISDSDSSDSDGEKCAICLKRFRGQLIGNPSNCDHNFCFPCLQKWSESSTTCPVDRSTFDSITVRGEINGPVMEKVKVENRNFGVFPPLDIDEVLLNEAINCEICGSGDDEETLLLCDFCNLGYHMACLRPPLSAIPAGAWYCPPCVDLHSVPAQNVEAFRFLSNFPERAIVLLPSARRPNRIRTSNNRSRPNGPLPRGRGPTRGFRSHNLSNSRYLNSSNVIESVMARFNAASSSQSRRRRKRRNRQAISTTALLQSSTAENLETTSDAKSRIIKKVNQSISNSGNNSNLIPRPRGPRDIVDMVFPSFSLFGGDELDYFSDGPDEHDVDGEVAIMARVRNEYTARRLSNRKNIVTSLDNYHDRGAATASVEEITETPSSVNLLDTILESQTLWHSKNVEIKSKKDGSLEIKMKGEQNKKPDLSNTNHSSKEIPLFPNKGDGASGNKSYTNSNSRYSSLGNSSGSGGNSFSSSTSSFNNLNPSTRPGFSNLLGNNSSALDLSPFRGAAPIRFRMNPPRPMMRRQNYNSNSQRHPSNSPASLLNSVQSPKKSSNVGSAEEDVDLYDDIETENADNEKSQEIFSSLEPPPEPPALLIGSDSSSDDENNGLVIDDNVNKSNIYDPTEPNEDSDTENNQDKNPNMVPGYLRSPSYGGLSEFGPHLPLPEPPALPMELDSVKDSDEEEEAECPNMTLYSSTSINLANNVQDIPIPDAAYPQEELECIPIPTPSLDTNATKEETPVTKSDSNLYSPTDKNDSETSSLAEVEISSSRKSPPPRRENSEVRSISSRDSSRDFSDPSSGDESDRSRDYEKQSKKRSSRRRSVDKTRSRRGSSVNSASEIDSIQKDKPSKEIDLTEVDSNDERDRVHSDDESGDSKADAEEIADKYDITAVSGDIDDQDEGEKSDNEKDTGDKSPNDVASAKSANEDDKTDSEDEDEGEKATVEVDKEKVPEDTSVDTSLEAEGTDKVVEEEVNATPNDVSASGNYLLPSEDLDPVSDVEYNDFSECQKSSSIRDKRKKRKKTRRRDSSADNKTAAEAKELEEGEIEEEKSKRKYSSSQKKKGRSESPERSPDRRLKKKRDRKEKTTGKENKDTGSGGKSTGGAGGASGEDLQWKKLSKNTKERNYRDGKVKPNDKNDKARDREIRSRKEKRKEIERYDVRKIVSDKPPRPVRDEFGRDVSVNRSRSRTRSQSPRYMGQRRSKGTMRRSFSQDDWINWSPVRNQRRSRSRTRRTRSRSRNRSRLSGDRYRNRSDNRDREREYDKREPRKRKRSISSEIERYTPPPAELKKRRRSRDRSRKSESYAAGVIRPTGRDREIPAEYYYERSRSWSRSLSYASLTPEPELYGRFSRSPSIIEPPTRIPLVSPTRDHNLMPQNPQNLTVIVPNVDLSKKKHKKKKDSKKKKKKQPSKEVFTSGDNIVVSVNFDDNQKIISAKSSKRKHDDEKGRKKKKDETRKRRKQTLQVSEEVLNAKPVAVIDLNSSPCKEMSPTEVISLTDSGDEATVIIDNVIPTDRRIVSSQEDTGKSPAERRAYVMTQSGPKTPPEPPIKFVVNSTAPSRPLATNPIFEQDEIDAEDSLHYNKGPNTPPEPANQQRRSISPSTTMYDPFEPTKSRSQSPENAQYDKDATAGVSVEERRPVIDMFSDDNDKPPGENQISASAEKSKPQEDIVKDNAIVTPTKSSTAAEDSTPSTNTKSPAKDSSNVESANETAQPNGVNTLVLDLSSLGDDFVPKSSIPLVKTSQGKYEFQSGKAPDKPITVVISQQSQAAKPQPQQVMVTPTRQVPTKQVEPIKQPLFPELLPWKLPPPMSQTNFSTPPPTSSSLPSGNLITPSKSAPGLLAQNGNQDESSFEVDDSPYSPASSEGDDLFEPPPLNVSTASPNKQRPSPMPAVNPFKSRVDALFSSSPIKKIPPRSNVQPHGKPVSAIKGTKKILKPPPPIPSKKDPGIRADEEQLKILDDVPNSAVEMMVKEKFLKKLHRQERVVEEVKVVLKPHYAKKHITKEEYKDILRKAVPKICHNKSGDINPSKIQGLVEAYVKKVRHAKKKPTMGAGAPLFPPMKTTGKAMKPQKSLWG